MTKKWILYPFAVIFCTTFCFSLSRKEKAIINASISNIEKLCEKNKLAFYYSDDNSNALQIAITGNNIAVAEWLAENEICDVNHHNVFGKTPINAAIDSSDIDILKTLVEHGAKIKRVKYLQDPVLQTVIIGNVDAAKYFGSLGIKYNFIMNDGKNMIHVASENAQKDIVPFLVESGCDINATDKENNTPLLISIEHDNSDLAKALIENGASVEKKNSDGQTPIYYAISKFSNATFQAIMDNKANIEATDKKNRTPFLFAYEVDNLEAAKRLIKAGSSFPKQHLLTAVKDQKRQYLPLLLEAGADISVTDNAGQNALHVASSMSDGNSLELFLGIDNAKNIVNTKDKEGSTPLILACSAGTGFTTGVQSLLKMGASVSDTNSSGNNSLHASLLSNPDSASKELSGIILKQTPSLLNVTNKAGQTPLMLALKGGKNESSDYLLSLEADVSPKDSSGNTALHYASETNLLNEVKECVSLGADVNAINNANETPICIAARKQYEPLAEYFLAINGINIDKKDGSGTSAREYLQELYDLRIEESRDRMEELKDQRESARDSLDDARKNLADTQRRAATGNAIAAAANAISIAAQNVAISKIESRIAEISKKIEEERAVTQQYRDKKKVLREIPRR